MTVFERIFRRKPQASEVRIISIDSYGGGGDDFTGLITINDLETLTEVRNKAKLPTWYIQSPYGAPRSDDMQTFRTLAQMGVVQRCIELKNAQIFSTNWNIIPTEPTDDSEETKTEALRVKAFFEEVNIENKKSLFEETTKAYVDKWEIGEGVLVKMYEVGDYVNISGQDVILYEDKASLKKIQSYDASQFQIWQTQHGELLGHWQFNFIGTSPRFFTPRELIIFADQETTYRPYARSRIRAIQDFLETVAAWSIQLRNFYQKGAILQGILKTSGLNPKEQKRLEKFFKDKFKTMTHKMALLQGGKDSDMEFIPLMLSVKDLAFLEGFEFIQDFIMSEYGVIRTELYGSSGEAKAGAAESSRINRKRIRTDLKELEEAFNREIVYEISPGRKVKFEFEKETDPEILRVKQETSSSQLEHGQITLNEWRKDNGKEPYKHEEADIPAPILAMQQAQAGLDSQMEQTKMQVAGAPDGSDLKQGDENDPDIVSNRESRKKSDLTKAYIELTDLIKTLDTGDVGVLTPTIKGKGKKKQLIPV